ncbi:hypothetical protein PLESTB_000373300 [Pleodorina starrii]|uniref:Glycerophosphocholine acyltransferase 1 n=1 Tax=Pleodorina starrii TaxID=330485 RepID=A0A9W6EZK5_9CHLO|nr:hypothetical protein PLESTM_000021600 [Pleodorina starrii]GLC50385.1 hypothetical protein PLESTB_000373300 [Pleodorina starrii]GLC64234.1 hypothetical protein PLESTF_000139400 [Pleodorina starrii]
MNQRYIINARSNSSEDVSIQRDSDDLIVEKLVNQVAKELNSGNDALHFTAGIIALCLVVSLVAYSPTLCPLVYLGFAALCLPYRVVSFASRKWTFFLVDFCYFGNLACCAFLLFRPEDRRLEAAVYALCEGPLAAALIAWQCAWLLGSPDHVISVLIHLLPGLAMYCHRFLAVSRQPFRLATHIGQALLRNIDPWVGAAEAGAAAMANGGPQPGGLAARLSRRLAAAAAISRGRVPCPAFAAAAAAATAAATPTALDAAAAAGRNGVSYPVCTASAAGASLGLTGACLAGVDAAASVECYTAPAGSPPPCPSPAWLWLGAAPVAFYLAWQLLYFLVVQVACRRMILAGGYDTSYRALARRAQRANSPLNRLVRSGSVARRLLMYGLLQLLFTLAAQGLAVVTYHSFAAATAWQIVKLLVPLYLGACHQCLRLPAQQLRAAAAKLAAAGALARVLEATPLEGNGRRPVVQARAES